MNRATSTIFTVLAVILAFVVWENGENRPLAAGSATSAPSFQDEIKKAAPSVAAIADILTEKESPLREVLSAAERFREDTAREEQTEELDGHVTDNPYSEASRKQMLGSMLDRVARIFGTVDAESIGKYHLTKFNDYFDKVVASIPVTREGDGIAVDKDNPYQRLKADGGLQTVLPNASDPEALAEYRRLKRENYLSKVQ